MASSSSSSSSFVLLLCVSIFLAVSSVGKAQWVDDGFNPYDYLFSPPADPCDDVNTYFPACQDFLTGNDDSPSSTCCDNLVTLKAITDEEGSPSTICQCIENLNISFEESRIKKIYDKCDIHLNFPISEHMDCFSV